MNKILILPDKIIEGIKFAFKKRKVGIPCSNGELSSDLDTFIDEQKNLTSESLYDQFENGKKLSHRTIGRAMNKDKEKHQWGAREKLRNLLCYYAYEKNWNDALEEIGTTEEEVEKETLKIKNAKQKADIVEVMKEADLKRKIIDHEQLEKINEISSKLDELLGNQDDNVENKLLEALDQKNVIKAINILINDLDNSIKKFDISKSDTNKESYLTDAFCIANLLYFKEDYEKSLIYFEIVKNNSHAAMAYYCIARSLVKLERYDEAFDNINTAIRIEPFSHDSLNLLGVIYFLTNQPTLAKESFDNLLELYAEKKLIQSDKFFVKSFIKSPFTSRMFINTRLFNYFKISNFPYHQLLINKFITCLDLKLYNEASDMKAKFLEYIQNHANWLSNISFLENAEVAEIYFNNKKNKQTGFAKAIYSIYLLY